MGQNHVGIREGRRRGRQWKSRVLEDVHVERLWRIDCFRRVCFAHACR